MNQPLKQHLIDPEICIRCYACEEICAIDAISHNDDNVVIDASICNYCMDCISPCPTGSIDNWRVVEKAYLLDEQFSWLEIPTQMELASQAEEETSIEAFDSEIAALLAAAHQGAGGKVSAPVSASKPTVNLFGLTKPADAVVQGNFRLTEPDSDSDVRHIILDLGTTAFPVLEGQSIGIAPPGLNEKGKPHLPRLYSISSPRDGERPNTNNLSLTVKREEHGVCSNYICDLQRGDTVKLIGPFGSTFLMPDDPQANLIMICTGTGSAPFRAFTMRRQRTTPDTQNSMSLFFGARTPQSLPYFGPLNKIPTVFLDKYFAFSRAPDSDKEYVQDKLREVSQKIAPMLSDPATCIYICGLKAMEDGVESAFEEIAAGAGLDWQTIRGDMRKSGRYHVETY